MLPNYTRCMSTVKKGFTKGTTFYVAQLYNVCMYKFKMDSPRDYILCCLIIQCVEV